MKIQTIAKYIDQPIILNKLHNKIPSLLITAGAGFGIGDYYHHKNNNNLEEHKKHIRHHRFLQNSIVIASTIAASLIGTRGLKINGKQYIKGLLDNTPIEEIKRVQANAIDKFRKNNPIKDKNISDILTQAKDRALKIKEIEVLTEKLENNPARKELFKTILSNKENISSKEIFSEIKRLSLLGLVPVIGGVSGGIVADAVTGTISKKKTENKVKEGLYQYLANIFLCNVGAGAALYASEKLTEAKLIKPLTPMKKLGVILGGIIATGVIGGSFIANYISKKVVNPMFGDKSNEKLYSERKPEALDIALHVDDIATAGVLSGFKWIEPALPFMYFISGYRAGIGYRNGKNS